MGKDPEIRKIASAPRPYKVEGAPKTGLYFTSPYKITGHEFFVQLGYAFREVNNSIYEKNSHAMELWLPGASEREYESHADIISQICKNSGVVFIVKGPVSIAEKYNADGLIFEAEDAPDVDKIREKFGEDFIIGIDCKNSMVNAKKYINNKTIDYVSFDYQGEKTLQLAEFWKNNSQKPCVVKGYIDENLVGKFASLGIDFIGCGDFIWDKKDKVAEGVKSISESIEKALKKRK